MCRVIAVSNQKGGVGKTTTSINLGVGLARMGQRVLLVDSDPQGYLTLGLGFPKNIRVTLKNMMENIIMGIEFDPKEAILHHKEGTLDEDYKYCLHGWLRYLKTGRKQYMDYLTEEIEEDSLISQIKEFYNK